jgi:hypothetical protein
MQNRVFFPQSLLDRWIVDGSVDLRGDELTILTAGRRYKLVEAVRVLWQVGSGGTGGDPKGLTGRVKARSIVDEMGAEIVETSMLIGDAAFDVEPGWLGEPVGSFAEHLRVNGSGSANAAAGAPGQARDNLEPGEKRAGAASSRAPQTEEELLGRLL